MATKIGVSESARFLSKNKSVYARIATPGGYSPERFIERIAPKTCEAASHVEGLHLFTFNQVAETQSWREELIARLDSSAAVKHRAAGSDAGRLAAQKFAHRLVEAPQAEIELGERKTKRVSSVFDE